MDSHHHVHRYPLISPIVAGVARDFRIPGIRLYENLGVTSRRFVRIPYGWIHNAYVRAKGFVTTDRFGSIKYLYSAWYAGRRDWKGTIECMVHPQEVTEDMPASRRRDMEILYSDEYAELLGHFELISYGDLLGEGGGGPGRP